MKDTKLSKLNEAFQKLTDIFLEQHKPQWLNKIFFTLSEDCIHATREAFMGGDLFYRRSVPRNLFSLIEGTVFCLKLLILDQSKRHSIKLEEGEEQVLQDKTATLSSNGKVKVDTAHYPTILNVKYTLKRAYEFFNSSTTLDLSNSHWQQLQIAIKVRDRLMHPKHPNDLDVTEIELKKCREILSWFLQIMKELFEAMDSFYKEKESIKNKKDLSRPV
jgi:hypothetical protein